MPQLDATTYASQWVWLAITFIGLYIVMAKVALPKIAEVLETRKNRIDSDLEQAEASRVEAQRVMQEYEAELAKARANAHKLATETRDKLQAEAAGRQAEIDQKLSAQAAEAEGRIKEVRAEAMGNLSDIAVDVANAIATKLVGEAPAEGKASVAVEAALKEAN